MGSAVAELTYMIATLTCFSSSDEQLDQFLASIQPLTVLRDLCENSSDKHDNV
jgi:hypothetical protein